MTKRTVVYPANTSQFLRGDASFETAGGAGVTPAISGSNGSFTFSTATFGNLNGLSFYTSNGSVVGSYTVPAAGAAITVSDAASSGTIGRLAFTNLNGVTLSLSTGAAGSHTIVGSHNALTSQSNQAFSADASSTFQTLTFQNSNGVSFSNNAGALRVTHDLQFTSATSAITSNALHSSASRVINVVAATNNTGGGTASLSSNVSFSAANGITFYTSAGNAVIASHNGLTTAAQSDHSHGNPQLNLTNLSGTTASNSAGFTLSLSAAAPGGGAGITDSYFRFPPMAVNTLTFSFGQSTSHFVPMDMPNALSIDRVRLIASGSVAASSTQATTGNTSFSMSGITSHNFVFYSRGTGASSLSLQYVTSAQLVDQQRVTFSINANSSQHSVSNRLTLGSQSFTKDYSSSVTRLDYHTSNLTDLTGMKQFDFLMNLSFSQGQWWIGYGRSTASATQNASISVATRMLVSHNAMLAVSQNTLAIGQLGGATASSVGWLPGHGSFSTAGGGTTSSLPISAISTTASNNVLFMQFMRIA